MIIIGQGENIDFVISLFNRMSVSLLRIANASYDVSPTLNNRTRYVNSFLLGVPQGLTAKFEEERSTAENDVSALVVATEHELREAINKKFHNIRRLNTKDDVDHMAFRDGYSHGKSWEHKEELT